MRLKAAELYSFATSKAVNRVSTDLAHAITLRPITTVVMI